LSHAPIGGRSAKADLKLGRFFFAVFLLEFLLTFRASDLKNQKKLSSALFFPIKFYVRRGG
jgi:hypothetical protein